MRLLSIASALVIAVMSLTSAATAKDIPSSGVTMEEISAWLSGVGYTTKIITERDNGRRYIDVDTGEGPRWQIYLYDCHAERCGSLQFAAGYDTHGAATADKINDWNRHNRWCRAYMDSVNDPWLEYDVDLTPGGTYELLADELAIWIKMNGLFSKSYGF